MDMKQFKLIILFAIALFFINVKGSTAKERQPINLEERVKQLENYKANIDNLSKIQSENLKKNVDAEVKKALDSIDEAKKTLNLLVYIGIPGTVISLIVVFFGAVKYAKKLIMDKIVKVVEGNREEILRVIETEAFDNKLKKNKELLVISGSEDSQNNLKGFMEKLKFDKVTYRIINTFNEIPDHDLMIFNNFDGALSQDAINTLMQNTDDEDVCYVAFTNVQLERNPRLNFSNSRYTLYHSILSTLKYSDIARIGE